MAKQLDRGVKLALQDVGDRLKELEAEVERLRGLLTRFVTETTWDGLSGWSNSFECPYCMCLWAPGDEPIHDVDCLFRQAQAALEPSP